MKTLQEMYDEIMSDKELKAQAVEAVKDGKLEAFLKAHGCEATMEEVAVFLTEKANADAPLSSKELENAAGGECNSKTGMEVGMSIVSVGFGCAFVVIDSFINGYFGQQKEGDKRLCNK